MAVAWGLTLIRVLLFSLLFVALCACGLADVFFLVVAGIAAFTVSVWFGPVIVIVLRNPRALPKFVIASDVHKAIPRTVPAA